MTHWKTLATNSETISAADLGAHRATATIESVTGGKFEDDNGKVDRKALISFEGREKKFAANVINCQLIEAMFGPEVENWVGHAITLAADKVEVAGKYKGQPCVRVYGSPELTADLAVPIALPKRKPFQRTLCATQKVSA